MEVQLPTPSIPEQVQPSVPVEEQPQAQPIFARLVADGPQIVDEKGQSVILRGCNLGNWLLLEMWMLDIHDIRDQHEFISILRERFGPPTAERLMDLYRVHWIGPRDFRLIKEFGFNVVRVPFHYSLLEQEEQPFRLRTDAFKWLDHVVQMASNAGVYVILDMHGAPGGQSADHTTGRADENRLWEDETCRKRFVWLWGEIARHFRDNPVVAGYDLLNEPFGVESENQHRLLVRLMEAAVWAIRNGGDRHLIFLPATRAGFGFYGAPARRNWANVGFTDHFYPGLFGSEPTPENHAKFIYRKLPAICMQQRELNAPFLVGEFNVVFEKAGGPPLMRYYYDLYSGYGWAATMWSYKLVHKKGGMSRNSWAMVANQDPAPPLDIRKASLAEIEAYFAWLGTMTYAVNEPLRTALTSPDPPLVHLPPVAPVMTTAPARDSIEPWNASDIGQALAGGQKKFDKDTLEIYGGGDDIWGRRDQFRFLWQKASGDFRLSATVTALSNTHVYAKAGIMLRSSLDSDAAHLLLHVFPYGKVVMAWREGPGATTHQKILGQLTFPVQLSIARKDGKAEMRIATSYNVLPPVAVKLSDSLQGPVYAGLAVLSHDNTCLTTARFADVRFTAGYWQ